MKKFTSIGQYRNAVQRMQSIHRHDLINIPKCEKFTGTCKLHGSNVAIQLTKAGYQCQSKNRAISINNDQYGFASMFHNLPADVIAQFFALRQSLIAKYNAADNDALTIYGEIVGPGIQKNVALCTLPEKHWVIFAAYLSHDTGNEEEIDDGYDGMYVDVPADFQFPKYYIDNILQGPTYEIEINFADPSAVVDQLIDMSAQIGLCCSFSKQVYGIEGTGEGIVWKRANDLNDSSLWFKIKDAAHSKNIKKPKVTASPEQMDSICEFVQYAITDERLRQGFDFLSENNLELTIENLGKYIQWVAKDIRDEEGDVLIESNLSWRDVARIVTEKVKTHYILSCQKL